MRISVVIPAYNAQSWFHETLMSVSSQAEQTEIIVVDDCSQDDTASVARDFIAQNGLIGTVLSTEKNLGPSNARNVGWQAASSDWIQFLDADDILGATKLEHQISAAQSVPDDVAVLYSPWQHLTSATGDWRPSGQIKRSCIDNDTIASILKDPNFGYVGPTLIRRRALQTVGGFQPEMRIGEDFDLMLRIGMAGWRFQSVESAEPLFFYRDTPDSLWRKASSECGAVMQYCRAIRSAEMYLKEHSDHQLEASTRSAIEARYRLRLATLHSGDADSFELVLSWISNLAKSPIAKMDFAKLRWNFALRGMVATLLNR